MAQVAELGGGGGGEWENGHGNRVCKNGEGDRVGEAASAVQSPCPQSWSIITSSRQTGFSQHIIYNTDTHTHTHYQTEYTFTLFACF